MNQLPSPAANELAEFFWKLGLSTIKELETDQGILASGREEIYGCIFGRDSLITALKLLKAYDTTKQRYFLDVVRKILVTLAALQGKQVNIESGEEPGKCIHEFRTDNYEHLINHPQKPWYLYPDKIMRNFDSVDATPLFLIAIYRYWQKSGDSAFLDAIRPAADSALEWLLDFGDSNNDGFIDYCPNPERKHGGLATQNWMDSEESVFHENGEAVAYPVAPVEVQGYAYLALKLWARHYAAIDPGLSASLDGRAKKMKQLFNRHYVLEDKDGIFLASAIDGKGKPLAAVRSSMGHVIWAGLDRENDGCLDSILEDRYIPSLARRLMAKDLFEPEAGIRTLSTGSVKFSANSYHNGSIWPHDNSIIAEGLEKFGFREEAAQIRQAIFKALSFFGTPIELFVYENGEYKDYCSPSGQRACKKQAWSAASLLAASLSQLPTKAV